MKGLLCVYYGALCSIVFAQTGVQLYEAGRKAHVQEDWHAAIEFYQEALKKNASYNLAYRGLAECFYALGEYDQALHHVRKAQKLMAQDLSLEKLCAFSLVGQGELDQARSLFEEILARYPNDVDARFGLAEIEVSKGRLSSARLLYQAALERQAENRKALLSLALISYEAGHYPRALTYVERALQYHGDNAQVHFFAAYLATLRAHYEDAERYLERALHIKSAYPRARALLSAVLYARGAYERAVAQCDQRIRADRTQVDAWYVKTLSLLKLGKHTEALATAKVGLTVDPRDDLMRILLEEIAIVHLEYEDEYRMQLARFHTQKADGFARRNMSRQALDEYRRTLKVYPYDGAAREAYARLLLRFGYPERSLEQLKFLQSIGKSSARINDAVEAYEKTHARSIKNRWRVDALYLDKAHLSISLFYHPDPANALHPEAERFFLTQVQDSFAYNRRLKVTGYSARSHSYREAFRTAREAGDDYFALITMQEHGQDLRVRLELYVASTGSRAHTFDAYRSGNDRYQSVLRRIMQMLNDRLPIMGTVVRRHQSEAVIDLGTQDAELQGKSLEVVKRRAVSVLKEGVGLAYRREDVLGHFTVTKVSEDMSEGVLRRVGYYDHISVGDAVICEPRLPDSSATTSDTFVHDGAMGMLLALLRSIR